MSQEKLVRMKQYLARRDVRERLATAKLHRSLVSGVRDQVGDTIESMSEDHKIRSFLHHILTQFEALDLNKVRLPATLEMIRKEMEYLSLHANLQVIEIFPGLWLSFDAETKKVKVVPEPSPEDVLLEWQIIKIFFHLPEIE